ncbi:TetR/AcrR family transcriptional regulator [Agromyces kandeliae]|uniref:TetR family transcriptional regulator n=1 Tax=Agromyces kandeliae TaxID=2666141 RepID=A0A6L5R414_9MICO|nr:TetR family transcriptional regulator [Agromyces kandeliae]MRX44816.1 TetR family transcriptional regulator [Agromyces kandeliae]
MPTTKDRALEAAVQLLGSEGVRALSHARVDARAELPNGSTSNWFRTRRALLAGIIDWMAEQERADFSPTLFDEPTPASIIEGLCAVLLAQTGPFAVRTRARFALFLELGADDELLAPLRRQRQEFEQWTDRLVTAAGIPDPIPAGRALMALGDGLILHRLTIDPGLDVRPVVERAVRALAATA